MIDLFMMDLSVKALSEPVVVATLCSHESLTRAQTTRLTTQDNFTKSSRLSKPLCQGSTKHPGRALALDNV